MGWRERLRNCGYDVIAPDGAIWELAYGEWRSRSLPGAVYDTEDLAEKFDDMESQTA